MNQSIVFVTGRLSHTNLEKPHNAMASKIMFYTVSLWVVQRCVDLTKHSYLADEYMHHHVTNNSVALRTHFPQPMV